MIIMQFAIYYFIMQFAPQAFDQKIKSLEVRSQVGLALSSVSLHRNFTPYCHLSIPRNPLSKTPNNLPGPNGMFSNLFSVDWH